MLEFLLVQISIPQTGSTAEILQKLWRDTSFQPFTPNITILPLCGTPGNVYFKKVSLDNSSVQSDLALGYLIYPEFHF